MDALTDAIVDYAMDDSNWENTQLQKTAFEIGGIEIDPRTAAAAALGGLALPGVGALGGRMDMKQLALLALLGAAAGGGGHKLYQYLTNKINENKPPEEQEQGGQGIRPYLSNAIEGGIYGLAASPIPGLLGARGNPRNSLESILTSSNPAERLQGMMEHEQRMAEQSGRKFNMPSPQEIELAARQLQQYAAANGMDPNDPESVKSVIERFKSGNRTFNYDGDLTDDMRSRLQGEIDRLRGGTSLNDLQQQERDLRGRLNRFADPMDQQRAAISQDILQLRQQMGNLEPTSPEYLNLKSRVERYEDLMRNKSAEPMLRQNAGAYEFTPFADLDTSSAKLRKEISGDLSKLDQLKAQIAQARANQQSIFDIQEQLESNRMQGRMDLSTGELSDIQIGGKPVPAGGQSFTGKIKMPTALTAFSNIDSKLNATPSARFGRLFGAGMPTGKNMLRGALGGIAAGAGITGLSSLFR